MLHAYVQKFDAMSTLEIFLETKHGKMVIWLKLIGKKMLLWFSWLVEAHILRDHSSSNPRCASKQTMCWYSSREVLGREWAFACSRRLALWHMRLMCAWLDPFVHLLLTSSPTHPWGHQQPFCATTSCHGVLSASAHEPVKARPGSK